MRRPFSFVLALVAMLFVYGAAPTRAGAQAGAGAESYEVTISPPRRPGSEPAQADAQDAAQAGAQQTPGPAGEQAKALAATASSGALIQPPPASAAGTGAAAGAASAGPSASAAPDANRAVASAGPLHTLQVGAFRQQASATSLRDKLATGFPDVTVTQALSGGEPIYRVNVGRMPHGDGLDDLRHRLSAAGYPAFEVLTSATN